MVPDLLTPPPSPPLQAAQLGRAWDKEADKFLWWSSGSDGPCGPLTKICNTKPLERHGTAAFSAHQMRWAFWVVQQNSVRVQQVSTGLSFLALVPFYNLVHKGVHAGANSMDYAQLNDTQTAEALLLRREKTAHKGGVRLELDGRVSIRASAEAEAGAPVLVRSEEYTDSEFFLRYLSLPPGRNYNNFMSLKLPGAVPSGSQFHLCMKVRACVVLQVPPAHMACAACACKRTRTLLTTLICPPPSSLPGLEEAAPERQVRRHTL